MKVYFISGLAADRSVFKNIHLPPHCEPVYLDWIQPRENEALASYATRLGEGINPNEAFSLVGLSMGGMIAIEIACRFRPKQSVIISSISSPNHLPFYYRYLGALRLHRIIPVSFFQKASILKRLFTSETPADKRMLKEMIRRTDPAFIRWAMEAILGWECHEPPGRVYHIHGTADQIIPSRFANPTHLIRGGGHLMVMNRAPEINRILQEIFSKPA